MSALVRSAGASVRAGLVGLSCAAAGCSSPGGTAAGDAGIKDAASWASDGPGGCTPATQRCSGSGVQTCGTSGQWSAAWPCATGTCSAGGCTGSTTTGTSCAPGGAGLTDCGATAESCCASLEVAGGTYDRTYTNPGSGPTGTADPATVSGFRLDRYLVTVGRFRRFVGAWNGGAGYAPPAGSGKHAHLNAGQGLLDVGGDAGVEHEPGWVASDDANVAPTSTNLLCAAPTWTDQAGSEETLPVTCVNWWEAYAFCIWDGGFLPSEAEWEYAAAGGNQEREYPWGSTAPGTGSQYAIYGCSYPADAGGCAGAVAANIAPVGTATQGAGLWGQLDLAGNVYEWNLDGYAAYVDQGPDGANLSSTTYRVSRGGAFKYPRFDLLPPYRAYNLPTLRYDIGFRCARTP